MNALKTTTKFLSVIVLGLFLHLLLGVIILWFLDVVVFTQPFSGGMRSVGYMFFMIPALAWRAIPDPAGKLAYIPAILLPILVPFLMIFLSSDMGIFSTDSAKWAISFSALTESLGGVLGNFVVLKFGGDFIYKR